MDERIRQYFNTIFAEAPKTRRALDLKQEMMQSAIDKYNDMVADGYSEEDAYQNVINSIGDVTELFPEVEEKNLWSNGLALVSSPPVSGLALSALVVPYLFSSVCRCPR